MRKILDHTKGEYSASYLEDLSLKKQLCITLYQAANKTARLYRSLLEPYDLTFPQYQVLITLWDRGTSITVGDLCVTLDLETSTITPVLKRLEATGYVVRFRDRIDERRVIVALTEKGQAFRATAVQIRCKLFDMTKATPSDVDELRRRLDQLCIAVDQAVTDSRR